MDRFDFTLETNRRWWDQEHPWSEDGDEWKDQARRCGKSYRAWKASVVERFLVRHATDARALEIGCGHGRWSEPLADVSRRLWLVDLSPSCVRYCRQRFSGRDHVETWITDGRTLPGRLTGRIDFVWSYDTLVHLKPELIQTYLEEIERILVPGGVAALHHAGRRHGTLWLAWLRRLGEPGRLLYRAVSMGTDERADGWRSDVSRRSFARMAESAGLDVEGQVDRWGDGFGVPRFGDVITELRK